MNFEGEYIYIIKEREFIKTNEDVYKIGRSYHILQRMSSYPNGSCVCFMMNVSDSVQLEKDVLCTLRRYCKNRKDIGYEYFECSLQVMIDVIVQSVRLLNVSNVSVDGGNDSIDETIVSDVESNDDTCEDVIIECVKTSDDIVSAISKYLANNEAFYGETVNALDCYNDFINNHSISVNKLPYTRFISMLSKFNIYEKPSNHGPMLVFPMKDDEIEEIDNVTEFVKRYIVEDDSDNSFITLKQIKNAFQNSRYFNGRLLNLKSDLQRILGSVCIDQKHIKKSNMKNVFMGYRLLSI
jgi:hypothetical protein